MSISLKSPFHYFSFGVLLACNHQSFEKSKLSYRKNKTKYMIVLVFDLSLAHISLYAYNFFLTVISSHYIYQKKVKQDYSLLEEAKYLI